MILIPEEKRNKQAIRAYYERQGPIQNQVQEMISWMAIFSMSSLQWEQNLQKDYFISDINEENSHDWKFHEASIIMKLMIKDNTIINHSYMYLYIHDFYGTHIHTSCQLKLKVDAWQMLMLR